MIPPVEDQGKGKEQSDCRHTSGIVASSNSEVVNTDSLSLDVVQCDVYPSQHVVNSRQLNRVPASWVSNRLHGSSQSKSSITNNSFTVNYE